MAQDPETGRFEVQLHGEDGKGQPCPFDPRPSHVHELAIIRINGDNLTLEEEEEEEPPAGPSQVGSTILGRAQACLLSNTIRAMRLMEPSTKAIGEKAGKGPS